MKLSFIARMIRPSGASAAASSCAFLRSVKPGLVMTTESRAKARLELARVTMPQAMRRPIAGSRPGLERLEQGSHQRLRLPAFRA